MLLNCGVGEDLRVPWTARRPNQSILEEISPENSLEGLMLKLKLQYFGHLMRKIDSLEKTLMLGTIDREKSSRDNRGQDGWMASPTQWTWVWVNSRSWWWTGWPDVLQSIGSQWVIHCWATELSWSKFEERSTLAFSGHYCLQGFVVMCKFLTLWLLMLRLGSVFFLNHL